MYCRLRNLIRETVTTKEYFADFIYENLDVTTINNYQVIKDHFTNFTIDREYENFLTDQSNHSLSHLKFKLQHINEGGNWVNLFSITIETNPVIDPIYMYYFNEDYNAFPGPFNNFLNFNTNLENFYIRIEMETKFYLFNIEDENEEEIEDEEKVPIEDVFKIEECSVCLTNTPNIINIPCLHLSICKECEEKGKFKKCVTCRRSINRKILI